VAAEGKAKANVHLAVGRVVTIAVREAVRAVPAKVQRRHAKGANAVADQEMAAIVAVDRETTAIVGAEQGEVEAPASHVETMSQPLVETEEVRPVNKPKVDRPSKPAPKLTEAMQKGREPLRSFSDLMQFYQTQKDPQPSSTTSSDSSGNETGDTNTNSTE
jgi:hypothetical protein